MSVDEKTVTVSEKAFNDKVEERVKEVTKELSEQVEILDKRLEVVAKGSVPSPVNTIYVKEEKSFPIGLVIRAGIAAKRENKSMEDVIKSWEGGYNSSVVPQVLRSIENQKAMTGNVMTAGGFYIPEDLSPEIIPLLYATSIMRSGGARVEPMPLGNKTVRVNTSGTAVYWEDEIGKVAVSKDMAVGEYKCNAKKMLGFMEIGNDLLRRADINLDAQIQNDYGLAIATKEDIAFVYGLGTAYQPKGIQAWINADPSGTKNTAASGGTTEALIRTDLFKMLKAIAKGLKGQSNMSNANLKWGMSSANYYYIMNLREATTNQQPTYSRTLEISNTMFGKPVIVSENFNDTELFLIGMNHFVIEDTMNLAVEVFPNGTIVDNGTTKSGITRDATTIRAIKEVDCYSQYYKSHYC